MEDNIKEISLLSSEVRSYGLNPAPQLNSPVLDLSVYEFYLANPNQNYFYTLYLDEALTNVDANYEVYSNFGFNVVKPDYDTRDFVLAIDDIPTNNEQFIVDLVTYIICYIPKGYYPKKLYIRNAVYYSEDDRAADVDLVNASLRQAFLYLDAIYYLESIGEFTIRQGDSTGELVKRILGNRDRILDVVDTFKIKSKSKSKNAELVTNYRNIIPNIVNELKYKTIFDAEKIGAIFGEVRDSYMSKTVEGFANCLQFVVSGDSSNKRVGPAIANLLEFDIGKYIDTIYEFALKKSITTMGLFTNVSEDENIYSNIVPVYRKVCENLYSDIMAEVKAKNNPAGIRVLLSTDKALDSKVTSVFFAIAVGMKVVYNIDTIIPREFVGMYNKYVNTFFISKYGMLFEDKLTYLYNLPPVMLNITNKALNMVFKKDIDCSMVLTFFDVEDLQTYSVSKLIPPSGKDVKIDLNTFMDEYNIVNIKQEYNLTSSDITSLGNGHEQLKELLVSARDGLVESTTGKESDRYYTKPPTILNSFIAKKEDKTYLAYCKKLDFNYNGRVQNTARMYEFLDGLVNNVLSKKGVSVDKTTDYSCSKLELNRRAFTFDISFTLDDLYLGNLIDIDILFERRALATACCVNSKSNTSNELYSRDVITYLTNVALGKPAYRSSDVTLDIVGIYMLSRLKTTHVSETSVNKIAYENIVAVSSQNYLASALYSNDVSIYRQVIKPCFDRAFTNLADFKYFDITNSPSYTIVGTEDDGLIRNNPNRVSRKFSRQISLKNRIRCGKEGIPDNILMQ